MNWNDFDHKRVRGAAAFVLGMLAYIVDAVSVYNGAVAMPTFAVPMVGDLNPGGILMLFGLVWIAGGEVHGLMKNYKNGKEE